jgi:hypothetical protein
MRAPLALACALASTIAAQTDAQARVHTGNRVRVQALERVFVPTTDAPGMLSSRTGVLSRATRDSLWLETRTNQHAFSRDDVVRIEVSRRAHRSPIRGAIIGGVITGVVLGWYGCDYLKNCDDLNTPSRESRIIGGILPGAVAGAIVARLWRRPEHWVEAWADP